jgi:hypothetical protein
LFSGLQWWTHVSSRMTNMTPKGVIFMILVQEAVNRLPNSYTYTISWTVLEPILYTHYECKFRGGWFNRQNCD